VALVRYELLLLGELGFGLDLTRCSVAGTPAPAFVSPRTGVAVGPTAASGYEARLLPIPGFVHGHPLGGGGELVDGLRLTGHFLARDLLTERRAGVLAARERLVERLKRAVA
jgi:DNA repair protein RecO (recombination protein O)